MLMGLCVVFACGIASSVSTPARAGELSAYYTRVDSGEAFEQHSRTGPYADIVLEVVGGRLVFWRGSSYLPYWETPEGRWSVDEIVPRRGDGPAGRPDRVNTYSRVALIESTPERAVVHWRYLPEFGGTNPHVGVTPTGFVDEYFAVIPGGEVTRTVRPGTPRIDAWRDPANQTVQTFRLTTSGLADKRTRKAARSDAAGPVEGAPVTAGGVGTPVAWWRFDEAQGDATTEGVSGIASTVEGHKTLWKRGVSGTALQFDGYHSEVRFPASRSPAIASAITLEGWVAIGAYPWSWVPVVQQCDDVPEELETMKGRRARLAGEEALGEDEGDFTVVLKKEDDVGYFLGVDGLGRPGLKLRVGGQWEELVSDVVLERRRWHHLAGTYDKNTGTMALYVDGEPAAEKAVAKADIEMSGKDVRIGRGKPRRPIKPVRAHTFIDTYAFDGLIDEVRIHDTALSAAEIAQSAAGPGLDPDSGRMAQLDARVLPAGEGRGAFGAYYTHLKFYETWDNLWRFGEHPDVVVEFDEQPTRFVFWRGVSYIPMMVNEKGHWYSNEFNETWNKSGGQGCQEPMSDKESYTTHVRIIENTEARVVVHWRFSLLDVFHVLANWDENTGWADWADWYYYIYPDGTAVKKMHLWTHGERNHEWQEAMAILGPDQHPEDVLDTSPALVLADLEGNVDRYSWENGPPEGVGYQNKKIHVVKYRAAYHPYTIGDFTGGNVYSGEVTPYAVFPTWNHWPVSQMPSDGRYATYPDRTAHSSLTHVFLPDHEADFGDRPFYERLLMEGMTNKTAEELVPLARSWLKPAGLEAKAGCTSGGYDPAQRAYVLAATGGPISFVLEASKERPLVNAAFAITDWGDADVSLQLDGKQVPRGKDFRFGHPRTIQTHDLVVWARIESSSPVTVTLRPE
jgi:hypothetical protein